MPDISMCNGIKCRSVCPLKDNCYRYRAVPCEFRQSYFMNAPFTINEDLTVTCDYFSKIREGDVLQEIKNG